MKKMLNIVPLELNGGSHGSLWRTIDSAPNDGSVVLLYIPNARVSVTGGFWDDHVGCCCWVAGGFQRKSNPPAHWVPLPGLPDVI